MLNAPCTPREINLPHAQHGLRCVCFEVNMIQENTYLLWDESGEAVFIDCGAFYPHEYDAIRQFVAQHELQPVLSLYTHGHFDHIFGVQFLCDTYGLRPLLGSADIPTYECADMQMQMFLHRALPLQLPQVERGLEEGEAITFGHQRVKVINTPGHTPGGVCYYLADSHLLLSGDSLFRYSIGRCDLPGSDGASLVRALQEKILALPDETLVLPGHGPETNIADERVGNPYL